MKYLKKFNESFADNVIDYLSVKIDESKISFIDKQDGFVFILYDKISKPEYDIFSKYIKGVRFDSYECLYKYESEGYLTYLTILIVDKDYYNRNKKYLYGNIEWEEHPILAELKKANIPGLIDNLLNRYKDAQKAINLPEGISIIRNLDGKGVVEIWDQKNMNDPERFSEDEALLLQYNLFKCLGN